MVCFCVCVVFYVLVQADNDVAEEDLGAKRVPVCNERCVVRPVPAVNLHAAATLLQCAYVPVV